MPDPASQAPATKDEGGVDVDTHPTTSSSSSAAPTPRETLEICAIRTSPTPPLQSQATELQNGIMDVDECHSSPGATATIASAPAQATLGSHQSDWQSAQQSSSHTYPHRPSNISTGRPQSRHAHQQQQQHHLALGIPTRTPSLRSALSPSTATFGSSSPSSTLSSPSLGPMAEITPLPSPLAMGDSPGPWSRPNASPPNENEQLDATSITPKQLLTNGTMRPALSRSPERRKPYHGLIPAANEVRRAATANHSRHRSISEFSAEVLHVPRPRIPTVSGPGPGAVSSDDRAPSETCLKREEYLAERRGLLTPAPAGLPSPPPSDQEGRDSIDNNEGPPIEKEAPTTPLPTPISPEYYQATSLRDSTIRRWRALRMLGQGTFSKVMLAVSDRADDGDSGTSNASDVAMDEVTMNTSTSRQLVAVKIVEHGPAGGASEERVESSLKRELEIMKSIHHPSLVHLKAASIEPTRALLVLTYCPGGDLFDFASQSRDVLSSSLIQRIFSELVEAVTYLHQRNIVHRDIKLENVLMNIPVEQAVTIKDWQHYPYSVVTLTDLGLSRRIDPADPLLHTRCGSEDYAAPELLMGQPYDGRQTDAWALGVLLYALMESRLPFDPLPGASEHQKMRSRTVHRIARCDWSWCKFADDDGEPGDFGDLECARVVVEGLLKRATRRLSLEQVAKTEWVQGGVEVPDGIRFRDENDDDDV
ncbi:MAG: hypothetical protein M1823_001028 [Watsoniomyces obsoletus]|nr:MAG: hypothetical protein M1823_001028 [Watsoniomyces obsoletus]